MSAPLASSHAWDLVSSGYLEHNLQDFEAFSEAALDLAELRSGQRVLDVATGPGTLAVLAAQRSARVTALDFSMEMLKLLNSRLQALGLHGVSTVQGDGQRLAFDDGEFDAAFSMFGLMFFPDRAQGLSELHRVLRPGGAAVVSAWAPMNDIPLLGQLFEGLYAAAPELAPQSPPPPPPMSTPEDMVRELRAAGFDATVTRIDRSSRAPSLSEFLLASRRSFAPMCLIEESMGTERFEPVWRAVEQHMERARGPGPVDFPMRALLGVGRRSVHSP